MIVRDQLMKVNGVSSEIVRSYQKGGETKEYKFKSVTFITNPLKIEEGNSTEPYYITVEVNNRMYRELEGIDAGDKVLVDLNIGSNRLSVPKNGNVDIKIAWNNVKLSSIKKFQ